jgi:hypothetical protein
MFITRKRNSQQIPSFNWMLMEMMIRDRQTSIEDISANSWNDGNSKYRRI